MDRYHELEDLRRSLAMLPVGSAALTREDAMRLLAELQEMQERVGRLRDGLRRLVEEAG